MNDTVIYSLFDPTGNITLLVETAVPIEEQPEIARRLMQLEPETEQVGFVSPAENGVSLRMAGGEFCGNASMSAAAWWLKQNGLKKSKVLVHIWGTESPVPVEIHECGDDVWEASVQMPLPLSVGEENFPQNGLLPIVRFPGITHVILENGTLLGNAESLAPEWCRELGAEALGLMFLDREAGTMKPLVWVPAAGTLCWESSCASGTTAVGAFLYAKSGREIELPLKQPGGTLGINALADGRLLLSGRISLLHRAARRML